MANYQQPNTQNPNHPEVGIIPEVHRNALGIPAALPNYLEPGIGDKEDPHGKVRNKPTGK